MRKIYLNVPYSQKDKAKKLGAKWDARARKWYVTKGLDLAPFRQWFPSIENPRLTIELVPSTCWFSNVRSHVSKKDWDRLRKHTYKEAGYRCSLCGGVGKKHPVECHEIWHYDEENHIQILKGLISLCPPCHECKHMGLTQIRGREESAIRHLAHINGWTLSQAEVYVFECFEVWHKRSLFEWKLDISYLEQFSIAIDTCTESKTYTSYRT